jgi:large subunit ribosomal protein L35
MAQKTKKAFSKRFKLTGTGKVMRRSANRRHLLRNKSIKQKRKSGQDQLMISGQVKAVREALPFG